MVKKSSLSRRQFLHVSTASAVASLALPVHGLAATSTVRVGLAGCGVQGMERARQLTSMPGARLVAVCDAYRPRAEQAATSTGASVCAHWQELLAREDIDAVIVATPDHLHAGMAVAAMEHGKDVFCESPMALTVDDAKAFKDAAQRFHRVVQIGMTQAAEGQWHEARKLLANGEIGSPLWSQGSYEPFTQSSKSHYASELLSDLDWAAFDPKAETTDHSRFFQWQRYAEYSGGVVTERLYPTLGALMTALGPELPIGVSAAGGVFARDGRTAPDSFVMTAEYPSRHTVVLASSMTTRRTVPAIIRGDKGSIEFLGHTLRVTPETGAPREFPVPAGADLLREWVASVRSREACTCNETFAYPVTVAVAMALDAYRAGQTTHTT